MSTGGGRNSRVVCIVQCMKEKEERERERATGSGSFWLAQILPGPNLSRKATREPPPPPFKQDRLNRGTPLRLSFSTLTTLT